MSIETTKTGMDFHIFQLLDKRVFYCKNGHSTSEAHKII